MALSTSTLRPGFLVSLKTSVRGNVHYVRHDLPVVAPAPAEGEVPAAPADGAPAVAVDRWETERTIDDPVEHEAAKKARHRAQALIRKVCSQSAFGMLCPEVDAPKLDAAVVEAKAIVEAFNDTAKLSRVAIFVLTGKVSPDDVEAVRAINSEIRELMGDMSNGIERGAVDDIREAATRVKGIGEMLSVDARTKVNMAVETARSTATRIKKDGKAGIDQSAILRIDEMRMAFLDLDEAAEVAKPAPGAQRTLDLIEEYSADMVARGPVQE